MRVPGPVLGLLVIVAVFVPLLSRNDQLGNFLSVRNFQGLMHECRVPAIVALGMLLVIVTGGIDLSVGSVVALVTVVAMQMYRLTEERGLSPVISSLAAVVCGIVVGGLCGFVNGLTIVRLNVSPFVVTLGMMSVAKGLAVWLSGRKLVGFRGARPGWVAALQAARVDYYLFDPGVWIALLLALGVLVLLRYTVFGRHCYAVGSNEATAHLCGIDANRTKVIVYALAGLLTGVAGIIVFAQTSSGSPSNGDNLELVVIAAVVIGGASLAGGQGSVGGTLLGVLILGLLENGVNFSQAVVEVKYILIGAIVVINTGLSQWQRRRQA
jgi:ribose transport system permease protein